MKTKSPTKTIADVRVAVVQLECHPNFTLGALNYLKEPFIDEKPILHQLSVAGVDVQDLQMLCHNKYLLWHCARLVAVIDWLNNLGAAERPHVVVFSEGSVPRVFLKCLRKRLIFQCLVFAGTHALDDSREAEEEYRQMGISPEALKQVRKASSSQASVMPVLGESYMLDAQGKIPPITVLGQDGVCHGEEKPLMPPEALKQVRKASLSQALVMPAQEKSYILDARGKSPLLTVLGKVEVSDSEQRSEEEKRWLQKIKHSVTLRPKYAYSPFEASLVGLQDEKLPAELLEKDELPTYVLRLPGDDKKKSDERHQKPKAEEGLKQGTEVIVLPLICAEALQYLGSPTMKEADIVVISSYDAKHANFRSLQQHLAANQIPTIYCNDGKYGGSGIAIRPDSRPESWWFTSAVKNGTLPAGDAVLLMRVKTGANATQVGVFDPEQNHALLKISPIVPLNEDDQSFQVAQILDELRQHVVAKMKSQEFVDTRWIKSVLDGLLADEACSAVHRACISRLRSLAEHGRVPVEEWKALADSIKIDEDALSHAVAVFNKVIPTDSPTTRKERGLLLTGVTLRELERDLSLACYKKCRLLIEEDTMHSDAERNVALQQARVRLKEQLKGRVPLTPMEAATRFQQQMKKEAIEDARARLKTLVAALVERFGATAGMLFIVKDKPSLNLMEMKPPGGTTATDDVKASQGSEEAEEESTVAEMSEDDVSEEDEFTYSVPQADGNTKPNPLKKDRRLAEGKRLVCDIAFNVPYPKIVRYASKDKQGVVGYVACTELPYLFRSVDEHQKIRLAAAKKGDMEYKKTIQSTQSELAVPIFCPQVRMDPVTGQYQLEAKPSLIAVLNLEARFVGAFDALQIADLEAAAATLAPAIEVLRLCEGVHQSFGWNPEVHRWDRGWILNQLCTVIADAAQSGAMGTSASCTLWHNDKPKKCLFVKGTSKFDYEYIADAVLPSESFIGSVVKNARPDLVERGAIDDLEGFQRPNKAARMEVSRVVATPVYTGGDTSRPVCGVLTIYSFKHEQGQGDFALDHVFNNAEVVALAAMIGEFQDAVHRMQRQVAVATLHARLREQAVRNFDEFDVIREVCVECVSADWASLFLVEGQGDAQYKKLTCVSSSGLIGNPDHSSYGMNDGVNETIQVSGSPGHKKDRDKVCVRKAITPFVARSPECVLRKHNVPDALEPVEVWMESKLQTIYIVPQNKLREAGAPTRTAHRRLLATAVGSSTEVTGVIRLVRADNHRPFVQVDEQMIYLLGQCARYVFSTQQRLRVTDTASNSHGQLLENELNKLGGDFCLSFPLTQMESGDQQREAFQRLAASQGQGAVNRRWLDSFLQDVVAVVETKQPCSGMDSATTDTQPYPVHIGLRLVAMRENDNLYLRQYAYHALTQRKQGVDDDLVPRTKPCLGWYSVDRYGQNTRGSLRLAEESPGIVTFRIQDKPPHYNCPIKASSEVTGGITLPLRWTSRHGTSRGCLSIDFCRGEISVQLLHTVWLSALNLALLGIEYSGKPDELLRPGTSLEDWALNMFPCCDRVILRDKAGHILWEMAQSVPAAVSPWTESLSQAGALYGYGCLNLARVTTDSDGTAFKMPLWLGGFRLGALEVHVTAPTRKSGPRWTELPSDESHYCDEATTEPTSAYVNDFVTRCLRVQQSWALQAVSTAWFWRIFECRFKQRIDEEWKVTVWEPSFQFKSNAANAPTVQMASTTSKSKPKSIFQTRPKSLHKTTSGRQHRRGGKASAKVKPTRRRQ